MGTSLPAASAFRCGRSFSSAECFQPDLSFCYFATDVEAAGAVVGGADTIFGAAPIVARNVALCRRAGVDAVRSRCGCTRELSINVVEREIRSTGSDRDLIEDSFQNHRRTLIQHLPDGAPQVPSAMDVLASTLPPDE